MAPRMLWAGVLLGAIGSVAQADCAEQSAGPPPVAWWARSASNPHWCAGYVGGGTLFKGEPRYLDEGTWGLDYQAKLLTRTRVWLDWSHGRKYQGGNGAYRTDGHHIPVVFPLNKI